MNKSESIGKLATAMVQAQKAMTFARRDSTANYGRYADLAAVVEAIKAPLTDNGLAYTQTTDIDSDGGVIVETMLMHTSGEWISSPLRMKPTQNTPQGIGSAITYARRYGLQAICGIPTDDDDGDAASCKPAQQQAAAKPRPALQRMPETPPAADRPTPTAADAPPATGNAGLMSDAQRKMIWAIGRKAGYIEGEKDVTKLQELAGVLFGGKQLSGLTKAEASAMIDFLQANADAEAGNAAGFGG